MTFVIGFRCRDGVVLCTDSLEADGVTKRYVDKTAIIRARDWSIALTGAGPGGLLDKFSADVTSTIPRTMVYDRRKMESIVEASLSRFRSQYEEPFRILVGVQRSHSLESSLYRSDDNYLSPIRDHAHVGMGHSLWRFFAENLFVRGNSVLDNSRLAIFIMRQAIEYVDGVGGDIRLVTYTNGTDTWKVSVGPWFTSIENAREGWARFHVGDALKDGWRKTIPPTLTAQLKKFGGIQTPGDELTFLDGVKIEKLGTVSGQKKAANSFWCNRDKLRKRALLVQEREKFLERNNQ
jgi:hypothetical protein